MISMVSKCCLGFHKGVCGRHEHRGERRSCERAIPPDPAVNETLPVPLSVLTGRLCHTALELPPGSCSRHPTSLSSILSCQYKKILCFLTASIQFGRYVCCDAIPPFKRRQKEGEKKFFLNNQSPGKFDPALNKNKDRNKSFHFFFFFFY